MATHLVLGIVRDSFEVTVLTGTPNPQRVDGARYIHSELLAARNKVSLWKNAAAMSRSGPLLRLFEEADVVYMPGIAYPLIPAAKRMGKRVVVHLHDFQPVSYTSVVLGGGRVGSGPLHEMASTLKLELLEGHRVPRALAASALSPMNRLSAALVAQADAVVCVSKRQEEIVSRAVPGVVGKTRVVYNPCPPIPAPRSGTRGSNFLFLGGGSGTKGLGVFLRASRVLKSSGVSFTVAGVGPESIDDVRKMCGSARYDVLGRVPHAEAARLYHSCLATVVPSMCEETFSYVVLESMLSETIPIASRVGGIPEVVSGTTAERFLFETGDSSDLAEKMAAVASLSPSTRAAIGSELRETAVKRFDGDSLRAGYLDALLGTRREVAAR